MALDGAGTAATAKGVGTVPQVAKQMQHAQRNGLDMLGEGLQHRGMDLQMAGQGFSAMVTAPIVAAGALAMKASLDFESAFAGIKKTTDEADLEAWAGSADVGFARLKTGIIDMSKRIPTAASELAKIGELGGQMGVGAGGLLSFIETVAMLGATTNLSTEAAATSLAQFSNIMGTSQGDISRLGSTVVDLGNKLAATESQILDMSLRLAGAGRTVGLTEAQVLGFAGALASVGLEPEAAGTAFSRLFIDLARVSKTGGKELALFAGVAGVSMEEFRSITQSDVSAAATAFLVGMRRVKEAGGDVFAILDALGMADVRYRDAILRATSATDLFSGAQKTAQGAWTANTALATEAGKRYDTNASKLEIAKNKAIASAMAFGDQLAPAIVKVIQNSDGLFSTLTNMAFWFSSLPNQTQATAIAIFGVGAAVGPALYGLGIFTSTLGSSYRALAWVAGMAGPAATAIRSVGVAGAGSAGLLGAAAVGVAGLAAVWQQSTKDMQKDAPALWQVLTTIPGVGFSGLANLMAVPDKLADLRARFPKEMAGLGLMPSEAMGPAEIPGLTEVNLGILAGQAATKKAQEEMAAQQRKWQAQQAGWQVDMPGVTASSAAATAAITALRDALEDARDQASGTREALSQARSELQNFATAPLIGERGLMDQMGATDAAIAGIKSGLAQKKLDRLNKREAKTPAQQLKRLELQREILGYQNQAYAEQHRRLQVLASDQGELTFGQAAAGIAGAKASIASLEPVLKQQDTQIKALEGSLRDAERANTALKLAGGADYLNAMAAAGAGLSGSNQVATQWIDDLQNVGKVPIALPPLAISPGTEDSIAAMLRGMVTVALPPEAISLGGTAKPGVAIPTTILAKPGMAMPTPALPTAGGIQVVVTINNPQVRGIEDLQDLREVVTDAVTGALGQVFGAPQVRNVAARGLPGAE